MLVSDILKNKGREVYSIDPNQTVYEAIATMDELDIGALVVLDGDSLDGILSERDYRSKVILKGRSSKSTKVHEIMTSDVYYVTPSDSVQRCMGIMTEEKIRHLPVMEQDTVAGVISIGDLVKSIISKQKSEISNLRHYIQGQGSYPG
ncbi:CBS domain-containing protein [Fodinibius halophilus]|uniref:CBS domain-containing protein n=1 Tax=Fodinibius halophilus TaxID=1736908 RepID=A0A6M1T626_9BACT|nr:CBS domain-containing protein [Fodinibius halophilus]NGP88083.1 CBS domain-containing protein [Fodinibius halophilus]